MTETETVVVHRLAKDGGCRPFGIEVGIAAGEGVEYLRRSPPASLTVLRLTEGLVDHLHQVDGAPEWNMGFCQLLIIKDGAVRPIGTKRKNNRNIYRALCEKDGKLCIFESKKVMTYEFFVKCLSAYKVTHALYLDMGRGWNYAWYRDKDGKVKEIFPESKMASSYKYRTNWITFYK